MDDLKECREAFEAWVSKECDFCLDWHGGDPFDHGHTMDAWAAWQAALNHRAVPQANAEQDVPEPDMLWEADELEDGVTGNSAKDFAESYASAAVGRGETHEVKVFCATRSHKRTMRISVSADPDAEDWLLWEWVAASKTTPSSGESEIE